MLAVVSFCVAPVTGSDVSVARSAPPAAVAEAPNIYFYNLDDLRDAIPGDVDPLHVHAQAAARGWTVGHAVPAAASSSTPPAARRAPR